MNTILPVPGGIYLSPPGEKDIPAFVKCLNDREIFDRTLMIPFPYTETDALNFLAFAHDARSRYGHELNFVIRDANGEMMGGAGYHGKNFHSTNAHRDELGYWVAEPFRNKRVMSRVLPVLVQYGIEVRRLKRIEACIYAFNDASERLLLKNGFVMEGILRKAYYKNAQFFDAKLFSLIV
ncbi:MAG TPA: GNAT family N-acetyltransferase [Bacteroidia bacterium]|nr:GNAT family N-acetyltransferase [Bacteroidia bacterium]